MGNGPAGRRLSDTDNGAAVHQKLLSLRVENRAGLVFNLESFEPPELQSVLPKTLGSSCAIELELDRLASGAHVLYSSEVKISLGGKGKEYDIMGKHQGKEQKVGGAFDLRDGRKCQFLAIHVSMPSGWIVSSSTPLLACSLTQNSDDLQTTKGAASQEGKLGCCSWHLAPLPGRRGSFIAEVRILKTDSQTMQGREALLASAEKRAAVKQGSIQNGTLLTTALKTPVVACRSQGLNSSIVEPDVPAVCAEAAAEGEKGAVECSSCDTEAFEDAIEEPPSEPAQACLATHAVRDVVNTTTMPLAMVSSSPPAVLETRISDIDPSENNSSGSQIPLAVLETSMSDIGPSENTSSGSQIPPAVVDSSCVASAPCEKRPKSDLHDSSHSRGHSHEAVQAKIASDSDRRHPDGYEMRKPNKSGAIALLAKAEREQRQREEIARAEQKKREEEEKRLFEANFGQIVATQDAEFHIGLLHDQLRKFREERSSLLDKIANTQNDFEAASQRHSNAKLRLDRYGENPRIRAEADKAGVEEAELEQILVEVRDRLVFVEAEINDKEELLALQAVSDDL